MTFHTTQDPHRIPDPEEWRALCAPDVQSTMFGNAASLNTQYSSGCLHVSGLSWRLGLKLSFIEAEP